jgi:hypothetical protein
MSPHSPHFKWPNNSNHRSDAHCRNWTSWRQPGSGRSGGLYVYLLTQNFEPNGFHREALKAINHEISHGEEL